MAKRLWWICDDSSLSETMVVELQTMFGADCVIEHVSFAYAYAVDRKHPADRDRITDSVIAFHIVAPFIDCMTFVNRAADLLGRRPKRMLYTDCA